MPPPPPPGGLQLSKEVLVANRPDPRVEEGKKNVEGDQQRPGQAKEFLLGDLIFFSFMH